MIDWPNPYDAENAVQPSERRDQTEAGTLRRAAWRAERAGYTSLAILYGNAAWRAENGCEWLEAMQAEACARRDGGMDDVEVRECGDA